MTLGEQFAEAIRLTQAAERLAAMSEPIKTTLAMAERALEIAPELEPELAAVRDRLLELVDHVVAASKVVFAKVDLLTEDPA